MFAHVGLLRIDTLAPRALLVAPLRHDTAVDIGEPTFGPAIIGRSGELG
jgi:hypothetical protein